MPRTSTREFTYFCKSLCCPPTSLNDWPAPPAIEPELPEVEPAPLAVDPVDPALVDPVDPAPGDPALGVPAPVDPGAPVPPAVEPVEPVPDVEPVEPVLEPVAPAPLDEPIEPLPDAPLDRLALVSMKLPPAPDALPLVPVAPVVPVDPDAVLPLPDPDVRHPVATTVCP